MTHWERHSYTLECHSFQSTTGTSWEQDGMTTGVLVPRASDSELTLEAEARGDQPDALGSGLLSLAVTLLAFL
jgi:hypothetical protein